MFLVVFCGVFSSPDSYCADPGQGQFSPGQLGSLAFVVFVDAFDNDLMHKTLKNIVEGKTVEVPTYDFVTHSR